MSSSKNRVITLNERARGNEGKRKIVNRIMMHCADEIPPIISNKRSHVELSFRAK